MDDPSKSPKDSSSEEDLFSKLISTQGGTAEYDKLLAKAYNELYQRNITQEELNYIMEYVRPYFVIENPDAKANINFNKSKVEESDWLLYDAENLLLTGPGDLVYGARIGEKYPNATLRKQKMLTAIALMNIARQRKWTKIAIHGSEKMKLVAYTAAKIQKMGLTFTNYEPDMKEIDKLERVLPAQAMTELIRPK